MKLSEYLMFLALLVPTILLVVIATLLIAQPAQPASLHKPLPMAAAPAYGFPVDDSAHEGTY